MVKQLVTTYYYVSDLNRERIALFRALSGDSESNMITQFVRGYISRHHDRYMALARQDAESREIPLSKWAKIVYTTGMIELPAPKKLITPAADEIVSIYVETNTSTRKPLNYISLGVRNVCLLRLAVHYYTNGNLVEFISKCTAEQLERRWDSYYLPQIRLEDFDNWR